jgi:probable addiction module antidote protein
MTDVREFDAAYHLDNPKVIAAYLEEAFATGDKAYMAHAFRTVARARGMEALAKSVGMSRSGLYKALGPEGNPSFSTVLQFLNSLGMGMSVHPQQTPWSPSAPRKVTTFRSSKGTKLYAVRDKKSRFKDIQTYKRAHGQPAARRKRKK